VIEEFHKDEYNQKIILDSRIRRYGINPYRYRGQRYTTVMARVPDRFVKETLWPEFLQLSDTLENYLSEVTEKIVSQVICQDNSETDIVEDTAQLPGAI
jgi:tRNA nucleotidyltransferase (CCA-adding enzyme)